LRNFAAATIFMARVTFCVFLTEEIRLRMSRSVAIPGKFRISNTEILNKFEGQNPKFKTVTAAAF